MCISSVNYIMLPVSEPSKVSESVVAMLVSSRVGD